MPHAALARHVALITLQYLLCARLGTDYVPTHSLCTGRSALRSIRTTFLTRQRAPVRRPDRRNWAKGSAALAHPEFNKYVARSSHSQPPQPPLASRVKIILPGLQEARLQFKVISPLLTFTDYHDDALPLPFAFAWFDGERYGSREVHGEGKGKGEY